MNLASAIAHVLGGGVIRRGTKELKLLEPSNAARVKAPYIVTKDDNGKTIVFFPTQEEWDATDYIDPFYVAPKIALSVTQAEYDEFQAWQASKLEAEEII